MFNHFRSYHLTVLALLLGLLLPPGWLSAITWEMGLRWVFILGLSFLLSFLLTPICVSLGFHWGIMDVPSARKIHNSPIPRLGGLAIFLSVIFSVARNLQFSKELTGLVISASVIYLVGLWDDARGLSAKKRLLAQVTAALILVAFGVHVTFIPKIPGEMFLETIITVIWMVGITNAINFLDGVDGLASGMGALCALLFLAITWPTRQSHVSFFTVALAGACLGYLPYNWNPAKIFLGDAGSTFIGFSLAGLAIMGTWAHSNPILAMSTPLLILSIPIFDMIYTTISRTRNGLVHSVREWLEYAGKDHFHHRLMNLGLNVRQTVGFILMVNLTLGLASVTIRQMATPLGAALLMGQALLIFLMIVVLMLLGRRVV